MQRCRCAHQLLSLRAVRFVQRVGDLHRVLKRPVDREWTLLDTILLADIVERANVRMIQRANGPRLTLKALAQIRVGRQVRRQDFDCDGPIKPCVSGLIDFPHAARAERGLNFVRPESRACGQCHVNKDSEGRFAGLYNSSS